jgi:hypothetical protein
LGMGQKLSKIDQFSKIFLSTTAQVEENWMHDDVEQEGLYPNCEIYSSRGSGFAPRGRGGQTWYIVSVNIWTFLTSFW